MTPERWRQIEDLFHAARERAPGDRRAFLAAHCVSDSGLLREVESLLAQEDGSLLRNGVGDVASMVMRSPRGEHEGRAVGPYVLGPLLGAGAMGEVYRARDTTLGRDVAVKILPRSVAQHPQRLARFEREARILAALNHPNIGAIYGLAEGDGIRGLVLELIEGETLAERLSEVSAVLPLADALAIARQIADALDAAHDKGIVHRDLKPANIKITPAGMIKVLDFGLAKMKATEEEGPAAVSVLATSEGMLLGTVAYMSPEQARGLPVDKRTDIWAFGCVVYEMIAGRRPFPGASAADVLGAITSAEPDWALLPPETSPRIRHLLRRCLAKDPARRIHDIADARLEIEDELGASPDSVAATEPPRSHVHRLLPWVIAGVAVAAAAIAISDRNETPPATRVPARLAIPLPAGVSLYEIGRGPSVAVSPDGRRIVYAGIAGGRRQLYSRLIDGAESTAIAGTENGANPFFSPDGRWIGFTTAPEGGTLQRVPVEGGAPVTIVEGAAAGPRGFAVQGATWTGDDTIIFSAQNPRSRGLWRVAAGGGIPERLTTPGDGFHSWPQLLPGGRALLVTLWSNTGFAGARIAVVPASDGEPTTVVEGASYGRVVSQDSRRAWLVYARPEGLHAAPFDLASLRLAGPAVPVLDGVLTNLSGAVHFSFSATGLMAYIPGGLDEINKTPVWVGRDGTATEIAPIPGLGFVYRLSPDGRRLVRSSPGLGARDLWIDDLDRGTTPLRLTDGAITNFPIWTPDGRHVIYSSGMPNGLFRRAADRSGSEERLTTSANAQTPGSVSPDGQTLAYHEANAERATDLWLLPLQDARTPRRFLATPFAEVNPMFSPDGRWLAYSSNLSGAFEIWVAPVAGGGQFVVSKGGGFAPLWSANGRELYYRSVDPAQGGDMMAVSIDTAGTEPKIGVPRVLFPSPYQGNGDISRDGRFFLLKRTREESPSRVIQVVLNWFDDLQAKVPQP